MMKKEFDKKIGDFILGLDIGVNSLGWAVVPCTKEIKRTDGKENVRYIPKTCIALNSPNLQRDDGCQKW